MSTPPKYSIDAFEAALEAYEAKMAVAQQVTAKAAASISASHNKSFQLTSQQWQLVAASAASATEMLITPARSFSGHGRFADVIQVFSWVAENTSDYAITQRDRKDGAGLRADDLIEFQIILSGDESEAVAFQLRWLGGAE